MTLTDYIRVIADKIDKELEIANHDEVIRLTEVLRETLNKKLEEWRNLHVSR